MSDDNDDGTTRRWTNERGGVTTEHRLEFDDIEDLARKIVETSKHPHLAMMGPNQQRRESMKLAAALAYASGYLVGVCGINDEDIVGVFTTGVNNGIVSSAEDSPADA